LAHPEGRFSGIAFLVSRRDPSWQDRLARGANALTDLNPKSIAHDFEALARACFALIDRTLNRVGGKLVDLVRSMATRA
jgi:hypothetical protein